MTTTTVRTYKNAKTFSKDATRMARAGYEVVATFQEPSKNKPLRNLLKVPVGGTLLWGASIKGGKIVVTYQALGATPIAAAPLRSSGLPAAPALAVLPAATASFGVRLMRGAVVTFGVFCTLLLLVAILAATAH